MLLTEKLFVLNCRPDLPMLLACKPDPSYLSPANKAHYNTVAAICCCNPAYHRYVSPVL